MANGEVQHLGATSPMSTTSACARSASIAACAIEGEGRAFPADGDPLRLELLDVAAPDRARSLLVEVDRVDPAHVVRFEDFWIEHRRDGKRGLDRSYT